MLLAEFARRAHMQFGDDRQVPVDLNQVRAFAFGESYLIMMKNGKNFDVRDLETILGVMHDEFELWKAQWRPDINIVSIGGGGGGIRGSGRMMTVTAEPRGNFLPAPPVHKVVDAVRRAVTIYNLQQSWDQFNSGNL